MSGAGPSTATKDTATKDAGDSLVEAGPVIKRRRTSLSPSKTRSGEPEPQASVDVEMGPKRRTRHSERGGDLREGLEHLSLNALSGWVLCLPHLRTCSSTS
ncbi:hypothetical protein CERSUDRAFT_113719 [Gelatoporia subvermispora B]|uniref:Uncharacterized protein n=1 Tax=Ceriporiopsis subvermispora (strain B) TaxID=914234 RepID=M2RIB8_CERS8|nr:hypothetical protein CERSUDRAFT_113719 [Gelatoporia subvermispora B]